MILAVFDVDHTLIPGDSLKWFAWYIYKRGGMKYAYLPQFAFSVFKYGLGLCGAAALKSALLKTLLYGTSRSYAEQQAAEFARNLLMGKIHRHASERIKWHRERDHRIVLLSASPDIYLESFASELGADDLISTHVLSKNGYLTGELAGANCKGDEKLKRLSAAAKLKGADWGKSYGYGNSAEDIPFLQALGHPTAVNPDRKLKQAAFEHGWKIETWL
jgi:HAD superfamily hydrolase (TIGR01490 family)